MREWRLSIRTAGNTQAACLATVINKGCEVQRFYQQNERGSFDEYFEAYKDGCRFIADSPEELLGLVCMHEQRGDHWKNLQSEESELIEELDESAITLDSDGNRVSDND